MPGEDQLARLCDQTGSRSYYGTKGTVSLKHCLRVRMALGEHRRIALLARRLRQLRGQPLCDSLCLSCPGRAAAHQPVKGVLARKKKPKNRTGRSGLQMMHLI